MTRNSFDYCTVRGPFQHNFFLIRDLVIRNISFCSKGTLLGMIWALLNLLFMLGLYTFFFTFIFKV